MITAVYAVESYRTDTLKSGSSVLLTPVYATRDRAQKEVDERIKEEDTDSVYSYRVVEIEVEADERPNPEEEHKAAHHALHPNED